jgi:hypothetical protein
MQFSLSGISAQIISSCGTMFGYRFSFAAIAFGLASAQIGAAQVGWADESVYIQQAHAGSGSPKYFIPSQTPVPSNQPFVSPRAANLQTPELFTPARSQNGNTAASLTIGSFNSITQIQAGKNDTSAVSILGGTHDHVGVIQAGNNKTSNIALIGLQNVNLEFLQGPNSRPINMIIARLPNGSIMVRR